jgi:arginine/ornithine N-succinyltransferase beta subunit
MTATSENVVTIRAKAFAGDILREHRCMVDEGGTVRVWDSVAGHYTTCHSLSRGAQQRARKLAANGRRVAE